MSRGVKEISGLLVYLKFYPYRSALLGAAIIMCALLEFVSLSLFVPVIEYIQQGSEIQANNLIMKVIIDVLNYLGMEISLFNLLLLALLAAILQFLVLFIQNTVTAYVFFPVRKAIRDQCFDNLMDTSLSYYTGKKTGDMINIMTDRINTVGYAISRAIQIIADGLLIVAYIGFMLLVSWQVSLMVLGVALIKHFATMVFIRRSEKIGQKWLEDGNKQTSRLVEIFQGMRLIKSLSREGYEKKRFAKITDSFSKVQIKSAVNQEVMGLLDNMLAPLLFVAIIYIGIETYHIGSSYVLVYVFTLMKMVPKLTKINLNRNQLSVNMANADAILDLLNRKNKPMIESGNCALETFHSAIELRRVYFSYQNNIKVLKDVSFSVKKGERVAIVGASGSGKTSLINLLLRLYEPDSGEIIVDGVDLRKVQLKSWHDLIGVVDQDTVLFNDTVYNNIIYGNLAAKKEDVIEAAQKAHVHDVIMDLEFGYDSSLGERGVKLSGGQRQRIAIARAMIKNPKILIFDEATSALDTISEQMIQESINEISRQCTTIIVAHRLSTIRCADKIIVFERGEIIEMGSHLELMKKPDGKYREYHDAQNKMVEENIAEVEL